MSNYNPNAAELQRRLCALGHDIGSTGPRRDGVDGHAGDKTYKAALIEVPAPEADAVPTRTPHSEAVSFAQTQIDVDFLKIAFPRNSEANLAEWVEPVRASCIEWGIDTFREVPSYLANISVESADLTRLTESLNYSTKALISKFGRHRISVDEARRYGRRAGQKANQEMLANILYGGSFGRKNLGNTETGDGWKFKGYGPKQITGRANQSDFGRAIGMSIDEVPAYLRTKEGGMRGAGWFWKSHNLDKYAATPGVRDDRKRINGGTFGLAEVEERFDALLEELLRREAAL